jgi:hypothetical protein
VLSGFDQGMHGGSYSERRKIQRSNAGATCTITCVYRMVGRRDAVEVRQFSSIKRCSGESSTNYIIQSSRRQRFPYDFDTISNCFIYTLYHGFSLSWLTEF